MNRARKKSDVKWGEASQVSEHMHQKDQTIAQRAEQERDTISLVRLEQIKEREQDTRPIHPQHVEELKESIAVLGLLEPLVVDRRNRLLAGGHRLIALRQLKEQNKATYDQLFADDFIPVRIMPLDAESEPDKALQIEVAENEHRRDYTAAEVRGLADRLKQAGYASAAYRPRKGQKALVPALEVIVGKSRRTIMRYLHDDGDAKKSMTDGTLASETKSLQKIEKELLKLNDALAGSEATKKQAELAKKIPAFLKLVRATLGELTTEIPPGDC